MFDLHVLASWMVRKDFRNFVGQSSEHLNHYVEVDALLTKRHSNLDFYVINASCGSRTTFFDDKLDEIFEDNVKKNKKHKHIDAPPPEKKPRVHNEPNDAIMITMVV